ncbi:hypothetical protein QL285_081266 [Trifolium repens]|nr:hypothetical protein QL285_081266 [Trifolium repens]
MKNNKVNSKKTQSTEPVTYIGRQVRSNAELLKMLNIKREKEIDEAYIPEVQGSKRNQNMPSRNVGGTKFQLVGDQGTNTMAKGTKATMAEEPNKSSLNVAKKSVEGTKASFSLASHSLEKKYKLSTKHQSIKSKIHTVEEPNKKLTKRNLPSFSLASHSLEKKSRLSTSNESRTKVSDEANSHAMKKSGVAVVNESQPEHQSSKQPMKSATCHNASLEQQQEPKKTPKMPGLRAMLIDQFLKEHGVQVEEEDEEVEMESEEEDGIEREGEIATVEEGSNVNGITKKRTRGPTRCIGVHARDPEERKVITLDDMGEPIGPTNEAVAEFSSFIGTVARNATYCPLIYTTFKAFTTDEKKAMWKFVNDKYIIPAHGKKATLARIDDAWRRYKTSIKKKYFSKYPNLRERLKHRPKRIPKPHYKKLMIYWGINTVQDICKKNAVNRTKQKYMHRMGTRNFARVKAQLRAKKEDGSDVTQSEMFVETRTSRKGKKVDQDTQNVITKLHDSIQESNECAGETFQSIFGKEKAGRMRCLGRKVTPTVFKRNEEIAEIKRHYSNETTRMAKKLDGLQGLVRCLLKQANPDFDDEALDSIMENAMDDGNGASTSTQMHDLDKETHPTFEEGELEVEDDE